MHRAKIITFLKGQHFFIYNPFYTDGFHICYFAISLESENPDDCNSILRLLLQKVEILMVVSPQEWHTDGLTNAMSCSLTLNLKRCAFHSYTSQKRQDKN